MRTSFLGVVVQLILFPLIITGQTTQDTLLLLPVQVTGFFNERPYLRMPASVAIADSAILELYKGTSPVASLNQISGVRMEERSPGSYRLSIRGSLLRSPFGVRNVKVYIDEFPLTDAGGNTYLNLLDLNTIRRIEILKGPDGSLYGANSGGVVRIGIGANNKEEVQVETSLLAGSYGLFQQKAILDLKLSNHRLSLTQAFQTLDGFRENSSMKRRVFQVTDQWDYHDQGQLRLVIFYSLLEYDTPGGLTYDQWKANPRSARPSTNVLPGAVEQNAGVNNSTLYGGIVNDIKFSPNLKHLVAIFGSLTDYSNSFITNYEERDEKSLGIRTYLEATNNRQGLIHLTLNLGLESQQSFAAVANFGNRGGVKDTVQAADDLTAKQTFIFARVSADFFNKLILEASTSINFNSYFFKNAAPVTAPDQDKIFSPQVMPRITASYLFSPTLAWRATISRGYSPPTFSEIRSSDKVINTGLEPEWGYNYETGFRLVNQNNRLWMDVTAFVYHMQQAIVRRTNESGTEYFVNAGDIMQPGVETQLSYNLIKNEVPEMKQRPFNKIKLLRISGSYTMHAFKFKQYYIDTVDFSGNHLTGIPRSQIFSSLLAETTGGVFGFLSHTYTSKIPLNDANSVHASPSNLVYLKLGWKIPAKRLFYHVYAGIDNVLNSKYSLGYDINAFGGRYYNPASPRNFFAGVNIVWN